MTFPHFAACIATTFVPCWLVNRAFLTGFNPAMSILLGVLTFVVAQLSKNLVLATFVPEAAEGAGTLALALRATVAVTDVLAIGLLGFKWLRVGETRVRVLGLALGWTVGDNVFRRFFFFWGGLWQNEFSWVYMGSALDSNATLLLTVATVNAIDKYWFPAKRATRDPQQALAQALALVAVLPAVLALAGDWTSVAIKAGLGAVGAHAAAREMNLY